MSSRCRLFLLGLIVAVCSLGALRPLFAAESLVTFDDPAQAAMYESMLSEYRCLKCQNQNLADSHADLASDLRLQIQNQIIAGSTKAEIDEYLVARYGEFVLYRPRFNSRTAILWIGPFVLLLIGLGSVYLMARRRSTVRRTMGLGSMGGEVAGTDEEARLDKARRLLQD
jgi:cytochrome c-type biogenesis protein CcmH